MDSNEKEEKCIFVMYAHGCAGCADKDRYVIKQVVNVLA